MAVNWDTQTADKCKVYKLLPNWCEDCRDQAYCRKHYLRRFKVADFDNLTIWDILDDYNLDKPDFYTMTSEQIANYIGDKIGINFKQSKLNPDWYETIINRVEFSVHKSTYIGSGKPFISCDVSKRYGDHEGCGRPIDDIDEAVSFFQEKKKYFLGI